jgi:hypothetical protein
MTALARPSRNCTDKKYTRPLDRVGAPQEEKKTHLSANIFHVSERKIWSPVTDDGMIPGQTRRLTVGPKIILTLL